MFGKSIRLFKLAGFRVSIDLSWFILFFIISWSLASAVFPHFIPNLTTAAYWIMGIAGALGLFASIVFHELSHSLVARKFGLPMRGITLFVFGGVAEMSDEPPSPKAEFFMAIAGPIASVILGFALFGITLLGQAQEWNRPFILVTNYLGSLNIVLAIFNLIPAFPLDGGRILRSILWHFQKDLNRATRISSTIGSFFGIALIFVGFFSLFTGAFISGLWWIFIGFFIRNAAQASYQSVLVKKYLEGESIQKFMNPHMVTVPSNTPVDMFVENYLYHYHYIMFPVVRDHKVSCITTQEIKTLPREKWSSLSVGELARNCSSDNTVSIDNDAMQVLMTMNKTGKNNFMVIDHESNLVGIVTLKDLIKHLSLKMELKDNQK
ncbi:MAG: site-2 protease family protein [Fibrobacter sp.]|nr:site-2 protease family protein [Fibrobacter sp.]